MRCEECSHPCLAPAARDPQGPCPRRVGHPLFSDTLPGQHHVQRRRYPPVKVELHRADGTYVRQLEAT